MYSQNLYAGGPLQLYGVEVLLDPSLVGDQVELV